MGKDKQISINYSALYWKRNLLLKLREMVRQGFNTEEMDMMVGVWIGKAEAMRKQGLTKRIDKKLKKEMNDYEKNWKKKLSKWMGSPYSKETGREKMRRASSE